MFKISIVLLSRNRVGLLKNCIHSIVDNALNPDRLEIVVGMDLDDAPSIRASVTLDEMSVRVKPVFMLRHYNMHEYINFLARASTGNVVIVINDDTEFTSPGWDDYLEKEYARCLSEWPDGIWYGISNDDSIDKGGDKTYASFPVVTRQAVIAAGEAMDESCPAHGADVVTHRIYKEIGRVVQLDELRISHLLHNSQEVLARKDATAVEMIKKSLDNPRDYWTRDITDKVVGLRARLS